MLTIRHIEPNHESICTCESVSFTPRKRDMSRYEKERPDGPMVHPTTQAPELTAFGGSCKTSGENHSTFANGIIYVMNDSGKTVGTYDLDCG